MTRNVVKRSGYGDHPADFESYAGVYSFNAFPPRGYEGPVLTFEAIRVGDHAHVTVSTGRNIPSPSEFRRDHVTRSKAGRLIFAWADWLVLRGELDLHTQHRIAEVENPTPGMLERYAG